MSAHNKIHLYFLCTPHHAFVNSEWIVTFFIFHIYFLLLHTNWLCLGLARDTWLEFLKKHIVVYCEPAQQYVVPLWPWLPLFKSKVHISKVWRSGKSTKQQQRPNRWDSLIASNVGWGSPNNFTVLFYHSVFVISWSLAWSSRREVKYLPMYLHTVHTVCTYIHTD
jgi:hypothetical protein